ncbi:MAG TPA: gamma-glutamyltransferase [Bacteroidales bacterium]|nr:gamma-glutamyltransferase [Bacteroidales bacterium]
MIKNKIEAGILVFMFILTGCSAGKKTLIEGSGIITPNAMVVTAHPEASRAGALILKSGGNAVDAAVATEFALAVCYPEAGNIGGGGFMVIRTADGRTEVIDYREKAPGHATKNMFLDSSGNISDNLSTETHLASGIPGTVDGMITAHSKYGKLSFNTVIQPAIDLAKKGFRITEKQAIKLNSNRDVFIQRNAEKTAFVKDSLWKKDDILVQEELAGTLERIRDYGRDGFYSGIVASAIMNEMKRGNGIITLTDLADYRSVSRVPLSEDYKGYKIITVPPPSGGGILLIQLLRMTEPYPVAEWGFNSPHTIHLIVEAERRAFADRSEHLGDPDYMKVQYKSLLDKKYLENRMSNFDEKKASLSSEISPGNPESYVSEETTHYSVVDAEGNAVSATTTLNGSFGNSIVVQGAGFLLNNEMDDFSVKPGYPNMFGLVGGEVNSIAPGKKMLSSMSPVIVEKEGKLFMVTGTPGGSTIPTTVYQVIINVIEFGMSISEAVDAPRFHHQWLPDIIMFENDRFSRGLSDTLQMMGHKLSGPGSIGRINSIMILDNGTRAAGADKRGDNSASGY